MKQGIYTDISVCRERWKKKKKGTGKKQYREICMYITREREREREREYQIEIQQIAPTGTSNVI